MRFLLFDRARVLDGGRVEGWRSTTMADESLRGHFPRRPTVPATLVIESMIQCLGYRAIVANDFHISVVLSVLEDVTLPPDLRPGIRLDLFGELTATRPTGSMGHAWAEVDGEEVARAGRVVYAHVPVPDADVLRTRFEPFRAEETS